jgi:hypothetical protein
MNKVEVTTRYATRVDELTDAFAFVMSHLELAGPTPNVHITSVWVISRDDPDAEPVTRFNVVVEGYSETDNVIQAQP